jgi:transcriptional regulator with XRE-family HTH domain
MHIGNRLYELREAKGLTEDALGKRLGSAPTCISRVENEHVTPSLGALERWAKALDVELYQLFFVGKGKPVAPKLREHTPIRPRERSLLGLFHQMASADRSLLVLLARAMVRQMRLPGSAYKRRRTSLARRMTRQ